jgi:hypothetical protein
VTDDHFLIFAQLDLPSCDAFHWLSLWRRNITTDNYLNQKTTFFPTIGANGIVKAHEHIACDTIQKMISDAVKGAGITSAMGSTFLTYCFCRGSAQYYFMFVPVGKHWTLQQVRWWGGWAEGENVCKLLRPLFS